jgi:diguanylate cyclase (GGDEF)-like protein/PAS domain S-box-containing protein
MDSWTHPGACLSWFHQPAGLSVLSDLVTGLVCLAMPLALFAAAGRRRRQALARKSLVFAAFVAGCGLCHLLAAAAIWQPLPWQEAAVKAVTACLSVATACLLWPLLRPRRSAPALAQAAGAPDDAAQPPARLVAVSHGRSGEEAIGLVGHWQLDIAARALTWSAEMFEIFGRARESFDPTLEAVIACHDDAHRGRIRADLERAITRGAGFQHMVDAVRPSGEIRHIFCRAEAQLDAFGQTVALFGICIDRTAERLREIEREQREAALKAALDAAEHSEAHYRLLADNVTDLVVCLDPDFRWTFISPSSLRVTGYRPEELRRLPLQALIAPGDWPEMRAMLASALRGVPPGAMLFRARRKDGTAVWLEAGASALPDRASVLLSMRDVTTRQHVEDNLRATNERLHELARVDALTGLANRRCFDEVLELELRRCTRHRLSLTCILVDVDFFKPYNDTYGHLAGDACLRLIAQTLASFARRPGDMAARYGGEEFALILPGTGPQAAVDLAERIRHVIESLQIAHAASDRGCVTVSLGVSGLHPPGRADTPADIIASADKLLYAAKHAGRNCVMALGPMLEELVPEEA